MSKIRLALLPAALVTTSSLLMGSALASPASFQDPFEPNDTCVTAAPLPLGLTTGLTIGPDDDYFLVSIPANADLFIDANDGLGFQLDVVVFEQTCNVTLASASGSTLSYFDCGGIARDVVVAVSMPGAVDVPYTLEIAATEIVDDGLEDNDTCAGGAMVAIQSFTTPGLVVTGCDEDYFIARLQRADVQIQIDLLFSHLDGDVDLEILEFQNGACTGNVLASSTSTTDNESLSYVNTTNPSMAEAVVIRAFMKNGTGYNNYALTACFGDRSIEPLIGTQSCAGVINSTGRPATLCALGSEIAADDHVLLYCVDLPTSSVGYFITAPDSGFTPNPGGSFGNLCLGTPGRYSTQVLMTGAGSVFFQPSLTTIPVAGGGSTSIMAGDRQLWQFWHRDSNGGVAVSNFSSAIEVTFQ